MRKIKTNCHLMRVVRGGGVAVGQPAASSGRLRFDFYLTTLTVTWDCA
jgi:hypothetical protein